MISRYILQKTVLLIAVGLLAGCNLGAEPPALGDIQAQPSTTITTGETATLTIPASGTDLKFEWSAIRGSLSDPSQPAVVYTAPSSPGPDTVTVKVTNNGGEIIKSINFLVVELLLTPKPAATNPPLSANTPTPTTIPEPIACNIPEVTKDVFPQLTDVDGQFPFYGPLTEPKFSCEAVYDIVHSEPLALRFEYENAGKEFGFWGIGTPNGYDATSYREICFWAYAQKPNQLFHLKMKDISRREDGVIIVLEEANRWTQICTGLTKFLDRGIQLDGLENVNLGFDALTGSAEIWVDDFEFN